MIRRRFFATFVPFLLVALAATATAGEARSALDTAVAKLNNWNTPSKDRQAAMGTIRGAGRAGMRHVRVLLASKAWIARRDGLTLASQIAPADLGRTLVAGLADKNWAVRVHAASLATALSGSRRREVEPAVKALLKDKFSAARLAAYKTLVAWDPHSDYISAALSDPDAEVSYWAAQKYMRRGRAAKLTPEAKGKLIDSIIAKLRSGRWRQIENLAIATLLTLGPEAHDALYEAAANEPHGLRRQAVSTIGSKAGKAGVDLMFRFFGDPDQTVRARAMEYLSRYCDRRHAPRLVQILNTSGSAGSRRYTLRALGRLKYKAALPHMLRLLDHHDDSVRDAVLQAVGAMGDKTATPKLMRMYETELQGWRRRQLVNPIARLLRNDAAEFLREAIRDDHEAVRRAALDAANAYLKDDDKFKLYLRIIKEEDNDAVRETAISSLSESQATKALDALVQVLKHGGRRSRSAAASTLGRVKSLRAAKALINAYAKEEDTRVRQRIVSSLGRVRDARAVPLLKKALTSTDAQMRSVALTALVRFPGVITDTFLVRFVKKEEDEAVLRTCLDLINTRNLGSPQLLPRLAKLMESNDRNLRHAVVRCVSSIETPEAARILCAAIRDDSYSSVRSTAVSALTRRLAARKLAAGKMAKSLGEALETNDASARRRIVSALAVLADRDLAPLLLSVLKNDTSDAVRRSAAGGIQRVAVKAMVPQLLEAAKAEDRADTLVVLIGVLGELDDRRAVPFFKKCLRAAEPSVQAAALRAIGSFKDASLVPFYVDRFRRSTSAEVRLTSLRSISGSGDRRALNVLMRALKEEDAQIRQAALDALLDFCDPDVAAALVATLDDGAGHFRPTDAGVALLGRARLRSIGDRLLAAARRTNEPGALDQIYGALIRMGDRRVTPLLADVIRRNSSDALTRVAVRGLADLDAREHAGVCLDLARSSFGAISRLAASAAAQLHVSQPVVSLLTQRFREGTDHDKRFYAALLARAGGKRAEAILQEALAKSQDESLVVALCSALHEGAGRNPAPLRRIAVADVGRRAAISAIRSLAQPRDRANERALEHILSSSRPADVRAAALLQLVTLRVEQHRMRLAKVPDLKGPVLKHINAPEPELTLAAVRAAAMAGDVQAYPDVVRALIPLAQQTGHPRLRVEAVKALGATKDSRDAEPTLLKMLDQRDEPALLAEVARSLGALRSAAAAKELARLAEPGDLRVRLASVEALGHIRTAAAIESVKKAFAQTDVDRVRAAAAIALGRAKDPAYVPKLVTGLQSAPGLDVRAACAEALGAIGGNEAATALVKAMQQDSGMVREGAIRALGAMGAKTTLGEIRKMLDDPDKDVVAAAKEIVEKLSG